MTRFITYIGLCVMIVSLGVRAASAGQDAAFQELRGNWQVTELVDNGRVIAKEMIPGWMPSGGRVEFIENAMVFTSPKDGQKQARTFTLDATTYPRQMNLIDDNQVIGQGIYRMDDGRLVVCLTPPADGPRPGDFSAREGSRRVMMVLEKVDAKPEPAKTTTPTIGQTPAQLTSMPLVNLPAPPVAPATSLPVVQPLSDSEVGKLLPGTWKCTDRYGAFFLSLDKNGIYSTYRESIETSTYQKVFRKLPVSNGTWSLKNGQVVLQCTSATSPDRVYKSFPFTIRTVSATELSFIDFAGNAGKATRVPQ